MIFIGVDAIYHSLLINCRFIDFGFTNSTTLPTYLRVLPAYIIIQKFFILSGKQSVYSPSYRSSSAPLNLGVSFSMLDLVY